MVDENPLVATAFLLSLDCVWRRKPSSSGRQLSGNFLLSLDCVWDKRLVEIEQRITAFYYLLIASGVAAVHLRRPEGVAFYYLLIASFQSTMSNATSTYT